MSEGLNLKQKILIVDDAHFSLKQLEEEFKSEYDLELAESGPEAIRKAEETKPDLILLDILMDGMDGFEVCRRLKDKDSTRRIPIIFISAKDEEEAELKGFELGAVDYITKPFRLPIVRARVKTHLELRRKTEILESISRRDGLTGIYNRRQLDEVIAKEWKRAMRNEESLSIIIFDLDYFKFYNDGYGHLVGDECLKTVAKLLVEKFQRASDFVARYGGEEFVVLLPDTDLEKAELVAERFRSSLEEMQIKHETSMVSPYVTISAGVASARPSEENNYLMLFDLADRALYEAKTKGRNCTVASEL